MPTGVVLTAWVLGSSAPSPLVDARALAASPDAPVASISHVGRTRGRMSAAIPIVGAPQARHGLVLTLLPVLEVVGPLVPNDQWRGRAGLELGWRFEQPVLGEVALAIEHESDHVGDYPSVSLDDSPTAVYNDIALRIATSAAAVLAAQFTAVLTARWHFLTCNDSERMPCADGVTGGGTVEIAGDVVLDWGQTTNDWLRPFLSLHGRRLLPTNWVRGERTLLFRSGLHLRSPANGLWQLFVEGRSGTEIDAYRRKRPLSVGAGIAWSH